MVARIAVIDDDADFRQFMADALGERGWQILPCAEPLSAYDLLRETVPDLILLDVRIDDYLAGWDILTFLQLHATLHQIPVIVCTAAVDEVQERREWLRDHDITALIKPFDLDHLYALIHSRLRARLLRKTIAAPA